MKKYSKDQILNLLALESAGLEAQKKVDLHKQLYGPNNMGTNMSRYKAQALTRAIKNGKEATAILHEISKQERICGNCKFWNFTVDAGNGAFGECQNIKNGVKIIGLSFLKSQGVDQM